MITPADGKMLANGVDRYTLAYRLRDSFSNKVVPVISVENNSTQFKTVESTVKLNNGLYTNQLTSNPTGAKLVIANDLEIDNSPVVDVSAVNTTGIISALESPNNIPNGNYQYSFASGVPSKGLYPYISDNSRLEIQTLANVATSNAPAGATYPSTGDRIGTFAPIEMNAGNTNDMIR